MTGKNSSLVTKTGYKSAYSNIGESFNGVHL